MGDEPLDGFTVERRDDELWLTFSNRYGEADVFKLTVADACRVADAMLRLAGDDCA